MTDLQNTTSTAEKVKDTPKITSSVKTVKDPRRTEVDKMLTAISNIIKARTKPNLFVTPRYNK